MSFALHHFRKEVSHVRLRWLLWLMLLALQMAVNLEWIAPMPSDFKRDNSLITPFWLMLVKPVVWGVAFWLVVSSTPEDRPGNPDRFLGTRPLPVQSYFFGRVLAFLVLIVVPFGVQEGLYLWFSDRPWNEVLMGAGEAAFKAAAFLGWWLPFSLLWRRSRELWCGVSAVLVGLVLAYLALAVTINVSSARLGFKASPFPRTSVTLTNAVQWPGWFLVGTVILAGLAWIHLYRGWKLGFRLAAVAVLVAGTMVAIVHVPLPNPSMRPTAQAEVNRMTRGLNPAFTDYKLNRSMHSKREFDVWVQGEKGGFPAEYTTHWRKQKVAIHRGDAATMTANFGAPYNDAAFYAWQDLAVQSALSRFFPKDTLWKVDYRWAGADSSVNAGVLKVPGAWGKDRGPFSAEGKFSLSWLKWEKEFDLPLAPGKTATTAGAKWTVLAVDDHATQWGPGTAGALCVTLRLEHAVQGFAAQPWDWTQEYAPMLYAPHMGLVFLSPWSGDGGSPQNPLYPVGARAEATTWQRRLFRLAWGEVLAPRGPIRENDAAKLRFVVMRRSYAGASEWEGALPPLTLPADPSVTVHRDSVQEDEAFLTRLREMPKLKEGATVEEAREYLASIQDLLQPTFRRRWKEQLDPVVALLKPLAREHPELLTKVSAQEPWVFILGKLATVPEVRKVMLTEMPTQPFLGRVAEELTDAEVLLREVAPQIMSTATPQEGAHFSRLFMKVRDPAHVPWLIKVMKASMDADLYLHCRSFPEHREAADAAAREAALAWMQKAGPYVGDYPVADNWWLALGVRAGVPEVMERVLHRAKVSTAEELDDLMVGTRFPEAFGLPRVTFWPPGVQEKDRAWMSSMAALSLADLRFDKDTCIWSRADQQGAVPKATATPQR